MKLQKWQTFIIWIGAILLAFTTAAYFAIRGGYIPAPSFMGKQPGPHPIPAATRDGRWQQDVEYLGSQLPYLHVDPYFKISAEEFQKTVAELADQVPNLNDEQIIVGMMRIVASIGDGHTRTFPNAKPLNFTSLPIEMRWLEDGLIVVAASSEYEPAVGAKVVQVGEHPVQEVIEAVKPLVAADNDMVLLNDTPYYMAMPAILYGLDLVPHKDKVTFGFEARDGSRVSLDIKPVSAVAESYITIYDKAGVLRPLYEKDRGTFYWYQYLPDSSTVYVQYNQCAEQDGKPFQDFVEEVFALIDQHSGARLVLDVRFNGGGNSAILDPFIEEIKARPSLNSRDKLFVIIGRATYSSALQNAITLSQDLNAVLVGEPTGGKPNHYGEVRRFRLPNAGLQVQYSTRYWLNYPQGDPPSLEPDIYTPVTVADLMMGRDPALEAILQQ